MSPRRPCAVVAIGGAATCMKGDAIIFTSQDDESKIEHLDLDSTKMKKPSSVNQIPLAWSRNCMRRYRINLGTHKADDPKFRSIKEISTSEDIDIVEL